MEGCSDRNFLRHFGSTICTRFFKQLQPEQVVYAVQANGGGSVRLQEAAGEVFVRARIRTVSLYRLDPVHLRGRPYLNARLAHQSHVDKFKLVGVASEDDLP